MSESQLESTALIDAASPERFFNRELSWLGFNARVLEEANNPAHPLLERLRFVSISASNLDEFYTVRVAGLKGMVNAGVTTPSADGLSPTNQLIAIAEKAAELIAVQQQYLSMLLGELRTTGFYLISAADLTATDRKWLEGHFIDQIFPLLTPLAIDPAHPFPFLPNGGVCLAMQLSDAAKGIDMEALMPLPSQVGRFVRLPGDDIRFISIEQVVIEHVDQLFPNFKVAGHGIFRVLRDSEMEVDEEAEDLVLSFESALKRRRRGNVIRLSMNRDMPEDLRNFVVDEMKVAKEDLFTLDEMVGLADLSQLIVSERPDLLWKPFNPRFPERIRDFGGDCLAAIRAKDIVVHHPYESFDVVVQFLRQAAADPAVVSIKQTHAKISLVVRREGNGLRNYVHFGTGNYHPITAKIYTDLSFFTCDPVLCRDAARMFNYMTGYATPQKMDKLSSAVCGRACRDCPRTSMSAALSAGSSNIRGYSVSATAGSFHRIRRKCTCPPPTG